MVCNFGSTGDDSDEGSWRKRGYSRAGTAYGLLILGVLVIYVRGNCLEVAPEERLVTGRLDPVS